MAITAAIRTNIIELNVLAGNGAPGTTGLGSLITEFDKSGIAGVAASITGAASWTAKFPSFQTPEEFGKEFLEMIVPGLSAAGMTEGVAIIAGLLNSGSSQADVLSASSNFLSDASVTDASFGDYAAKFQNQAAVAEFHTVTQEKDTPLSLDNITSDAATVTAAKGDIDGSTVANAAAAAVTAAAAAAATAATAAAAAAATASTEAAAASVTAIAAATTAEATVVTAKAASDAAATKAALTDATALTAVTTAATTADTAAQATLTAAATAYDTAIAGGVAATVSLANGTKLIAAAAAAVTATALATAKTASDAATADDTAATTAAATLATASTASATASAAADAAAATQTAAAAATADTADDAVAVTQTTAAADSNPTGDAVAAVAAAAVATTASATAATAANTAVTASAAANTAASNALASVTSNDSAAAALISANAAVTSAAAATTAVAAYTAATAVTADAADDTAAAAVAATAASQATTAAGYVTSANAEVAVERKTFTLTAAAETIAGSAGSDAISGTITGVNAAGSTLLPGDIINAGLGDDTLTISTAGAPGTQFTIAAIITTGVENIMFNAYDTDTTTDGTILDMSLMTGVQKVGLLSGSATGDIQINQAKTMMDMSLANSAGDFNLNYTAAVNSVLLGDQTQNIALSNVSSGIVTVPGVEIVNVTTSLLKSTVNDLIVNSARTLNVYGDQNLTITQVVDMANTTSAVVGAIDATVDASTFTGKLNFTPGAASNDHMKITGGSGNDTINMAAGLSAYDVIDGGAGTDTITVNAVTATGFTQVTNVEITTVNAAAVVTNTDASKAAGTTLKMNLRDAADNNAKLTTAVTKLDGKMLHLSKTADAGDANNNDGVIINLTNTVDTSTDVANITLAGTGLAFSANGGYDTIGIATYETVNITANASAVGAKANEIITLSAGVPTTSIVVNGTGSLTTALTGSSKLTSFDASALAGALTLTAGTEKATYKMGASSSTLTMGSNLASTDTIIGGAGITDTVTATVGGMSVALASSAVNISDVERIYLTTNAANAIDMSAVTGTYTLGVTDNKQTITGFDLTQTISLGLNADAAATASEIDVTGADATGASDTLTVTLDNTAGAASSIIDASNIETLALTIKAATNTVTLNMATGQFDAITIGQPAALATPGAIALGTLHKDTASITSTSKGAVTAAFNTAVNGLAATYDGLGLGANDITGGAKNDTFTIGTTGNAVQTISGGGGTADTTNITVGAAFVNAGAIDTENVNVTVVTGADNGLTTAFHAGVDAIVLTGGNSLSTFTTGTLNAALKSFDASGFSGNVAMSLAADGLDTTVTFTGGPLATDTLSNVVTTGASTYAFKSTGVEKLILDVNGTSTVSMAGTDAVQVDVDVAAAKTATISNAEGTLVRVVAAPANSDVTVSLADSTGATDTLAMELDEASAGDLVDLMDINVANVEALSIKVDDSVKVDLSGLTMATPGAKMGLTLTGLAQLGISALGEDVTTINASAKLAGGVVQTGRSTTGTVEYTGGAGADTFMMNNLGDTMVGGAGADTLVITKAAILGGINVNLSVATNQVLSANGGAISGSAIGFESVNLAGYTGSFGAAVTAVKTGSTVVGTANIDQVNGGAGPDVIDGGAGATVVDVLTGGGGNDIYTYAAIANLFSSNAVVDTITETATGGTDSIRLDSTGTGFTISNTMDFAARAVNIEQFTVVASSNAYSITLKSDADSDALALRKIDLSGDTVSGGSNIVDLAAVAGAYTVIGGAGADAITGSLGVDLIDVSNASSDSVIIPAVAGTGVATAGGLTTSTATLDIIKAEAGDTITLTGIMATDANYDGFETLQTSGNLALSVTASTANGDNHTLRAKGIYDSSANTFTVSAGAAANAVLISFQSADAGTTATDSLVIVGVVDLTSMANGVITV